jgi:hypothetical protein
VTKIEGIKFLETKIGKKKRTRDNNPGVLKVEGVRG